MECGCPMPKPLVVVLTPRTDIRDEIEMTFEDVYDFLSCSTIQDVLEQIDDRRPDLMIVDVCNIAGGGHPEQQFLEAVQTTLPTTSIILLTNENCPEPLERFAVCSSIKQIRDPLNAQSVAEAIRETFQIGEEPTTDEPVDPQQSNDSKEARSLAPSPSISESAVVLNGITRRFETNTVHLKRMLSDLEVAAAHDVTILLIGETGAGKTFLSSLIHEVSPRRNEPFLHVACGALPAELIESELFGHSKGAFTSAHADKEGKFVAAGQGTVLLDEIDVLGPEQQVKLLRVIETGEFEPVGSNQTIRSQARLVVASNLDLQPLVEQGRFRPDLYYRLNMLKFEIPPLRQRKPDIIPLAKIFIEKLARKHDVEISFIEDGLFDALVAYPWPGNVRELENVIQRAVIFCRDGRLTAAQLPSHILSGTAGPTNDPSISLSSGPSGSGSLENQISLTEKDIIEQALFKNNFSRTNTAKELGISRVTLYNKMKKYNMSK